MYKIFTFKHRIFPSFSDEPPGYAAFQQQKDRGAFLTKVNGAVARSDFSLWRQSYFFTPKSVGNALQNLYSKKGYTKKSQSVLIFLCTIFVF